MQLSSLTVDWVSSDKLPVVARYMDKVFADEFMATGALRVPLLAKFFKHEDRTRVDASEAVVAITKVHKNLQYITMYRATNGYALCGSTQVTKELALRFGENAALVIDNPGDFLLAIGQTLQNVESAVCGNCLYVSRRYIEFDGDKPFRRYDVDIDTIDNMYDLASEIERTTMPIPLFMKHESFQGDLEYRFIWLTSELPEADYVDIKCPDAIKYCRVIALDDMK